MNYLLDTNVVSGWVSPSPNASVAAWLAGANEDEVFISVCTLAELRFGIASMARGRRRDKLDQWLRMDLPARFDRRIVPIDAAIADAWGEIQARTARKGHAIGTMDALIAATAEVYGLTLVTRNTRHFQHIGVMLLNPWDKPVAER